MLNYAAQAGWVLIGTGEHSVKPGTDAQEAVGVAERPASQCLAHVLFVDDEEAIITLFRRALERHGYRVAGFTDPEAALELFQSNPGQFDVVVTDQTMPAMTGVDLLGRLRRIRPGLPVILCTGYSEAINEDSAKRLGVDAFLCKPIAIRSLIATMESVLGSHKAPA